RDFASESLDADTASGAVFQTAPLPKIRVMTQVGTPTQICGSGYYSHYNLQFPKAHYPNPMVWSNKLGEIQFTNMGWLSSILRMLTPIAVEHGGQILRESLKSRASQSQAESAQKDDALQQLASELDQVKAYAAQLRSDVEALNAAIAAREERLRKWLLLLVIWNVVMTLMLVLVLVFAWRR